MFSFLNKERNHDCGQYPKYYLVGQEDPEERGRLMWCDLLYKFECHVISYVVDVLYTNLKPCLCSMASNGVGVYEEQQSSLPLFWNIHFKCWLIELAFVVANCQVMLVVAYNVLKLLKPLYIWGVGNP